MKTILLVAVLGCVPAVTGGQQVAGDQQFREPTVQAGQVAVAAGLTVGRAAGITVERAAGIGARIDTGGAGVPARVLISPELARRLQSETRAGDRRRSHWRAGAIAGVLIGGAATYHVLHTGGSTATCDREANQDAIGARECAAAVAAGAAVGGALGALIGSRFRKEP